MIATNPKNPRSMRLRWKATLAALFGVAFVGFSLFFLLENDMWVPIRIPTVPWSTEASFSAFEARLFAVMMTSFAVGMVVASLLWRAFTADLRKRASEDRERLERTESELDKVSKLLASSRNK